MTCDRDIFDLAQAALRGLERSEGPDGSRVPGN